MSDVIIGGADFSGAFTDAFETTIDTLSSSFLLEDPELIISYDIVSPEFSINVQLNEPSVGSSVLIGGAAFSNDFSNAFNVASDIGPLAGVFQTYAPEITVVTKSDASACDQYFVICSPTVTVDGNNVINCNGSLPNSYWDKESSCHDGEKEMFDQLQMDAWNSFGIDITYYVADYNTNYDKLYGEDRDRYITRSFGFKGYIQSYPEEKRQYSIYGIEGLDNFLFWANIRNFGFMSTLDDLGNTNYVEHVPIEGDIIRFDYSDLYYEIMHVVKSANQFLQTQHSYTFIVRVFRDIHVSLSPSVSSDSISAFTDTSADIFDISDEIDKEKFEYLFNTSAASEPPINQDPFPPVNDDPFGVW